jgi:hypothetical protein
MERHKRIAAREAVLEESVNRANMGDPPLTTNEVVVFVQGFFSGVDCVREQVKVERHYEEVVDPPEEDIRIQVSVDEKTVLDATGVTLLATIKKIGEQAFSNKKGKAMAVKFSVTEGTAPEEE